MKILVIALAFGDIYDQTTGELAQPLDGSTIRLEKALERAFKRKTSYTEEIIIISTAGFTKKNPRKIDSFRKISLADQMKKFLKDNSFVTENIIAKPLCWSTINEIRIGIKTAIRSGKFQKDENILLIVSSNWGHLPRIWLYTKMYTPKTWKVELIPVKHHFSFTSYVGEIVKILRDVCKLGKILWRFKKFKNRTVY